MCNEQNAPRSQTNNRESFSIPEAHERIQLTEVPGKLQRSPGLALTLIRLSETPGQPGAVLADVLGVPTLILSRTCENAWGMASFSKRILGRE